ncbi:hypothetical protein HHI36_010941 [Cryptolaemus montrouzieri]|uniref:Uncharacterized protein n=1 Tax=Cryptolaemus montrouzieri TaxID=559131 RepID=A0ABD2MKA2_9CUCU
MATPRNSRVGGESRNSRDFEEVRNSSEFGDRRSSRNQHYSDRNRIFSSTTTDYYRNKLSQIGIKKDLREILDRKKLQKDYEDSLNSSGNSSHEVPQESCSRKVRFEDEKVPLGRSKSFTSGVTKNYENYSVEQRWQEHKIRESSTKSPQNFKNSRGRKTDYVDLLNPTNIKIELKTDSGDRKCTVDANVAIAGVKCNLKQSRMILRNSESKPKVSEPQQTPQNERKKERTKSSVQSKGSHKSFRKNRENREPSSQCDKDQRIANATSAMSVKNVEESISNISITE